MQTLLLIGLWALLLQWGMLFFVRLRYRAWSWRRQHLVAALVLPTIVAGMAAWLRFGPASCPAQAPCAAGAIARAMALRLAGMMLVAAVLLLLIDRVRHRP